MTCMIRRSAWRGCSAGYAGPRTQDDEADLVVSGRGERRHHAPSLWPMSPIAARSMSARVRRKPTAAAVSVAKSAEVTAVVLLVQARSVLPRLAKA